jgi:uncharacterized protein (DUF1330 family)
VSDRIEHTYGTIHLDTAGRWFELGDADGEIWMINLMKYREVADYDEDAPVDEHGRTISGREADDRYAPLETLGNLGAMVAFFGDVVEQLEGEPAWDRIAIVRYPTRRSFLTMEQRDDFKKVHHHKKAGMDFTIIVGGLPVELGEIPPAGVRYVMRTRRFEPGAPAPVEPAGVTPVAIFTSDGTIIGDDRTWDEVRFDVVDEAAVPHLRDLPGVAEQITVVVGRGIDELHHSVETSAVAPSSKG